MINAQSRSRDSGGTSGISEKLLSHLSFASQSPLLEESSLKNLFATFFDDTNAHSRRRDMHLDLAHGEFESVASTSLLREDFSRTYRVKRVQEEQVHVSDRVARPNEDRLKLLARKYVAKEKFTDEQAARLEIVTERVRQLLPSVTVKEYEALEGVLLLVKDVSETDKQLRAELAALEHDDGDALSISQK